MAKAIQTQPQNLGTGLMLMATFTLMWSGVAASGETSTVQLLTLPIFITLGVLFLYNGLKLLHSGQRKPDETRRRLAGVFLLEVIVIAATSAVLYVTKHGGYVLPTIALLVGLHFYLIGQLYHRTLDFYLATWVVITATLGILLQARGVLAKNADVATIGVATATATSVYGLYMLNLKRRTAHGLGPLKS